MKLQTEVEEELRRIEETPMQDLPEFTFSGVCEGYRKALKWVLNQQEVQEQE